MNKHIKQLLTDLAWVLVAGAVAVAFILAAANLGGCGSSWRVEEKPQAPMMPELLPDIGVDHSGLEQFYWGAFVLCMAGAAMLATKWFVPIIPAASPAVLMICGVGMAFIPFVVDEFAYEVGLMIVVSIGISLAAFLFGMIANFIAGRKNGLSLWQMLWRKADGGKHEKNSTQSSPSGTPSESDDLSPHFLKG